MGKTKKVGSTGRFGTRYGSTTRKRVRELEETSKSFHRCPSCDSIKVKRESVGIWTCKFCGYRFAGGAWSPTTAPGLTAKRTAIRLSPNQKQK